MYERSFVKEKMLDEYKELSSKCIMPCDISNLSFIFLLVVSLVYSSLIMHEQFFKTFFVFYYIPVGDVAMNKTDVVPHSLITWRRNR